jgi:hypothetical protein
MADWPLLPSDVIEWFRGAFAAANRAVTEQLLNTPTVRETTLDDALIQALIPRSAPHLLASGAVVKMDIHNIGGLRRMYHWEVADISVLAYVYRNGRLIARKVGLLQAKRLYPLNLDVEDDDPVGFQYGMNAWLRGLEERAPATLNRQYVFNEDCVYAALTAGSEQITTIRTFERRFGAGLAYIFYNPPALPLTVSYPIAAYQPLTHDPEVGCRVVAAAGVAAALKGLKKGQSPTYRSVHAASDPMGGHRLEHWAADLLLTCQVGRPFQSADDEIVAGLLARRTGPIGAAILVSIELPEGGER